MASMAHGTTGLKRNMKFFIALTGCFLLPVLMSSCINYSAIRMPPTRESYNVALQNGDKEQLILNIVRIRYTDEPYFFTVNNIISQINYSNAINGGVSNTWFPSSPRFGGNAGDTITMSEGPTITYTPLQGDAFVTKMLTPVSIKILYTLIHGSSVKIESAFRLVFNSIGPFNNMAIGEVNDKHRLSEARDFEMMSMVLQHLAETSNLTLMSDQVEGVFAMKLTLVHFDTLTPKERSIMTKLGFTKKRLSLWMVDKSALLARPAAPRPGHVVKYAVVKKPAEASQSTEAAKPVEESKPAEKSPEVKAIYVAPKPLLLVETRALYAVLLYLSKSVEIPAGEQENQVVHATRLANGKLFDWRYMTRGVMKIQCSTHAPRNAYIAVKYRDRWFYVADNDIDSKATVYICLLLMVLYEGSTQNGLSPVFSILK